MEILDIKENGWKRALSKAQQRQPPCRLIRHWESKIGWGVSYFVQSTSVMGETYLVDFKQIGEQLFITCSCIAGQNDHPCVHAARVLLTDVQLKEYIKLLRKGEPIVAV